jgi:hypothetical protein
MILLVVLTAVACLPTDPTSGIGFILVDDEIHMLINRCEGDEIVEVNVRTTSDSEDFDPEDLWLVEGRETMTLDEWIVGDTPEGFDQLVPLESDLLSMEAFGVYVTFRDGLVAVDSVYPEDLSKEAVVLSRHQFTRDEFFALDCDF